MLSEFLFARVTNAVMLLNNALDRFSFGQNLTPHSIADVTSATFDGVLFPAICMSISRMTLKIVGLDFHEILEWVDYRLESCLTFGRFRLGLRLAVCAIFSVVHGGMYCTECYLVIACQYR